MTEQFAFNEFGWDGSTVHFNQRPFCTLTFFMNPRATNSLPLPLGPVIKTRASVGATLLSFFTSWRKVRIPDDLDIS